VSTPKLVGPTTGNRDPPPRIRGPPRQGCGQPQSWTHHVPLQKPQRPLSNDVRITRALDTLTRLGDTTGRTLRDRPAREGQPAQQAAPPPMDVLSTVPPDQGSSFQVAIKTAAGPSAAQSYATRQCPPSRSTSPIQPAFAPVCHRGAAGDKGGTSATGAVSITPTMTAAAVKHALHDPHRASARNIQLFPPAYSVSSRIFSCLVTLSRSRGCARHCMLILLTLWMSVGFACGFECRGFSTLSAPCPLVPALFVPMSARFLPAMFFGLDLLLLMRPCVLVNVCLLLVRCVVA
jgi:hypothetical protein